MRYPLTHSCTLSARIQVQLEWKVTNLRTLFDATKGDAKSKCIKVSRGPRKPASFYIVSPWLRLCCGTQSPLFDQSRWQIFLYPVRVTPDFAASRPGPSHSLQLTLYQSRPAAELRSRAVRLALPVLRPDRSRKGARPVREARLVDDAARFGIERCPPRKGRRQGEGPHAVEARRPLQVHVRGT